MGWEATPGSFFGAYTADLGLWGGEWPMQPATSFDGFDAANGDEIDLVICLPNPATPTDPGTIVDGTYPTKLWDAYRYGTAPGDTGWFWLSFGGETDPVDGEQPPAGAHLYVVAYLHDPVTSDFVEPPNPPEFYVPTSYGGTGAEPPGHWSAVQPGDEYTIDVHPLSGTHWGTDESDTTLVEGVNQVDDIVTILSLASTVGLDPSQTVNREGLIDSGAGFSLAGEKNVAFGLSPKHSEGHVGVQPPSADFLAPAQPVPSLPPDAASPPFYSTMYAYEDTWAAYRWVELHYRKSATISTAGNATVAPTTKLVVSARLSPVVRDSFGYPTGDYHLADIEVSPPEDTTGTLALLSALPMNMTLVVVPYATTVVMTGDDAPDFPPDGTYGYDVSWSWENDAAQSASFRGTTSGWRYWTETPSVKWHTVGGHFATAGGVTPLRLTPGVGWVEIVDGPA